MARRVRKTPKRKLSTVAWFGIGCGSVLVLGLIAVAVVWFMLTGEPAPPPEATASGASDSAAESRPIPAAPPLAQQVEHAEQAARSPQPAPVTMTIRESELNQMLTQGAGGQVRDLQVYLGSGSIAATGKADYRGHTVHLTVRAQPVVEDGALRVDVTEVMIGRMRAPDSVREQIRAEIDRSLQQMVDQRNIRVDGVQIQPDTMILSGWVGGR